MAVTAPLLAAGPNALTQSPTARTLGDTDCVALTVVDFAVVIVSFSVFGVAGFLDLLLLFEVVEPGRAVLSESVIPDKVTFDPFTAVTLPIATDSEASCVRKLPEPPPAGKFGRVPLVPPVRKAPPPPPPPREKKPPAGGPPDAPLAVPAVVHDPLDGGGVTLMERAAIVVLDFFEAVPVTVTQSPATNVLTAWDTVWENVVVDVQLTVVWPEKGLCTSMLEPLRAATLPEAPMGRVDVVAAPTGLVAATPAANTTAEPPKSRPQRRRLVRRLVGICISVVPHSH